MDDCRCPSTTCDCDDLTDRYVADAWQQHERAVTPFSKLRVVHGHDGEADHSTYPHGSALGTGAPHITPHGPRGVRRPPTNPDLGDAA